MHYLIVCSFGNLPDVRSSKVDSVDLGVWIFLAEHKGRVAVSGANVKDTAKLHVTEQTKNKN